MQAHRLISISIAAFLTGLSPGQLFAEDLPALLAGVGLCGPLENAFGPFDYRTASNDRRKLVEQRHFTTSVETLQRGATGTVGGDLDYTLRVFPNHPRALYAMSRAYFRDKRSRVHGAKYPAECYFDRAVRFQPSDPQVRALYADFLIRSKRPKEAKQQLKAAQNLDASPQVFYNLGLAWVELGEPNEALIYAQRAYRDGVTFPGLRDKLKAAGVWRE